MKKILFAIVGCTLAASADAAVVCATPPEMKVLQSAALQQQLMVAALSCHMSADYNAFVTAYRGRLQQSDQALQAFFAARPRGEDYNAYKTRLANTVSLRSTRDPQFCASAQKVFDMALGRGGERNGLAPEPPQLIDTGYEGCRPVDGAQLEVRALPVPTPRPQVAAPRVAMAKPKTEVEHALSLRPSPAAKPVPKPVQVATATPKPTPPPAVASAKPKPLPITGVPANAAPPVAASRPPTRLAAATPAATPADEGPTQSADTAPADIELPRTAERPHWQTPAADTAPADTTPDDNGYADDHFPNAYRPGAQWVREPPLPAWRPVRWYPPRPRWHRHGARMVLGPDGRWIVLIGTGPRWRE